MLYKCSVDDLWKNRKNESQERYCMGKYTTICAIYAPGGSNPLYEMALKYPLHEMH